MTELELNVENIFDSNPLPTQKIKLKKFSNFRAGFEIYSKSALAWRIWLFMAFSDIRRRYQRTKLGPFWVTMSIAIFIVSMGVIFPFLWHTDMKSFLPFFASGYIVWTFISSMTSEACGTFVDSVNLIKQTSFPYSIYANNVVMRNFVVLLHHLTVYFIIMLIFSVPISFNTLLFIPGMTILCLTGSWLCVLLGIITSRYRDTRQLVASILQIAMFVTPIFWTPEQLGNGTKAKILIECNPLHHFIQIVRAPLMGECPPMEDWLITSAICIIGFWITLNLFGKYRKHIVFWL